MQPTWLLLAAAAAAGGAGMVLMNESRHLDTHKQEVWHRLQGIDSTAVQCRPSDCSWSGLLSSLTLALHLAADSVLGCCMCLFWMAHGNGGVAQPDLALITLLQLATSDDSSLMHQ